MDDILSLEEKREIVDSFDDCTSWIDDENMGLTLTEEINQEIAEKHGINPSEDITYLFWEYDPIASTAFSALEELRQFYKARMLTAFKENQVKTYDDLKQFEAEEQKNFYNKWKQIVENFDWSAVQENIINNLLNEISSDFPNEPINKLRELLIKIYPDCSAYGLGREDVIDKVNENLNLY